MWLELALLGVLALVYLIVKDSKPRNMAPGPFEIPFVGSMPCFTSQSVFDLKKKYGDLVTKRTGYMRSIFIFDYHIAKEVMGRADMTGRPDFFSNFSLDDQKIGGLVGAVGQQWQHDRRFALRNLRNLGMGKTYLEEAIQIEAEEMINNLKSFEGKPIEFPDCFRTAALNIIWQMVSSRRFSYDSKEIDAVFQRTKEFQNQSLIIFLPMFFPSIKKILPDIVMRKVFKTDGFENFLDEMRTLLKKTLDEHEDDLENPRDFLDEYKKEMQERIDDGTNEFCRDGALLQIINDLFGAGSDTINNMLKSIAFLLATRKEAVKRIREEIDEVVPRGTQISIEHKSRMPYTEAFMNEALRYSSMIILNVQRVALQDTTIGGYFIPKDTVIQVGNCCIHRDPRYWDQPEEFKPERFLDENGKYTPPKAGFFAFGLGRRQCLGEVLARMELFLFTAAMVQNLDIEIPEGVECKEEFVEKMGMRLPKVEKMIYKTRK